MGNVYSFGTNNRSDLYELQEQHQQLKTMGVNKV